jgi:hypothetical protein
MDLAQHQFTVAGNSISLTNTEYQFLQLLMADPLRIFSRGQILEAFGLMKGLGPITWLTRTRLGFAAKSGRAVDPKSFRLSEASASAWPTPLRTQGTS